MPNSVEILKNAMLEAQKTMQLRMEEMQEQSRKVMEEIARQQGESAGILTKKIALLEADLENAQKETLKRTLDAVEEKIESQARTTTNMQETLTDVLVPVLDKTKEVDEQKEVLTHLKGDIEEIDKQMRMGMSVLMREVKSLQVAGGQVKPGTDPGASPVPSITRRDLDDLMSALTKKIDDVHKDVSRVKAEIPKEPMVSPVCVTPCVAKSVEVVPEEGATKARVCPMTGVSPSVTPAERPSAPPSKFAFRDTSKEDVRHQPIASASRNQFVLGPSIVSGSNMAKPGGDTCHVCPVGVGDNATGGGMCFPCS